MVDLLPGSVADERMVALERVAQTRLASIDLSVLLVALVDHVVPSALPALGWQFGALGPAWSAADEAGKRALLRRSLARRRKRGTAWAVQDALEASGFVAVSIIERPVLLRDGTIRYDGTFQHGYRRAEFWVVVVGSDVSASEVSDLVRAWKRCSAWEHVFFVSAPEELSDVSQYVRGL